MPLTTNPSGSEMLDKLYYEMKMCLTYQQSFYDYRVCVLNQA